MPRLTHYAVPHLWGTLDYSVLGRLQPDGDTIHLRNPRLLFGGRVIRPECGMLEVTMPGRRPQTLELRGDPPSYLPIRLSGIDAPEAHYVASVRPNPHEPAYAVREKHHYTVCQPHHQPALAYILRVAARWPSILVELDRDLIDQRGRVLGFLYASDDRAERQTFVSLQLVRRGLALPFVFESAGDYRPRLLSAGARARRDRLGVWRHYVDKPLAYRESAFGVVQARAGAITPRGQLNHPMIFRRVVEAAQLQGFQLRSALRKYDCFDHETGDIFPGDQYWRVHVDRRVWAPHRS
jgi:endonuclease YncB( thermonuclease family)